MNFCSDVSLIRITILVLIILFIFGLLTYSELFKIVGVKEENTLILAHVFFRNGETTIDANRNPFSREIPVGSSELTNSGKSTMFEFGLELRRNYLSLVGNKYSEASIGLTCLNAKVFKDSLMLALAGLFPLRGGLKQQHVSIELVNTTDPLLHFLPHHCPKFDQLYSKMITDGIYSNLTEEYRKYFEDIRKITNETETLLSAFLLDYNIESGLNPPEWSNELYPHPTKLLSNGFLEALTENEGMKRILSGTLLNKILNDTIENIRVTTQRRLYLYSVEKYNLEYLIRTLGILGIDGGFERGSYISLEIHKFEGIFFLKVVFKKLSSKKTRVLELPYCGKICPLHYFIEINRKYLATNMCDL